MSLPSVYTFTSVIYQYISDPYASLFNGMVLGVDLPKDLPIYDYFKKTGLLHLVVLSGSNINFLVTFVTRICGFIGTRYAALVALITITCFIMFVGPEPPVVRAGLMSASTLIAVLYHRKSIALVSLLMTAVVIGIAKFEWLTSVSFQLSFGASLGIILWSGSSSPAPKNRVHAFFHGMWEELKTTLSAQLVTTPLIFFYFKEVSLVAPLSNILVGFAAGPIMMLGLVAIILGKINFYLGFLPAYGAGVFLLYIGTVTKFLADLPYVFMSFK